MILLCGVDEAGRGPLTGSVFAAAVILGEQHGIAGLADSKTLSASKRAQLADQIKQRSLAWAVASASNDEIDRLNILQATMLAMRRAIEALPRLPDEILVDGNRLPSGLTVPAQAIVKGDAKVVEISAASILAKTARDAEAQLHDAEFPGYGIAEHKGYPTAAHLAALKQLGPCRVHRRSFGPVRALLAPVQKSLW